MPPRPNLSDDERSARRQEILAAAERLYGHGEAALPSVAAIAVEAGLAKGTVYLYFATKEEIFLALMEVRLEGLIRVVGESLAGGAQDWRARFIAAYVGELAAHPGFLRLAAIGNTVIERNLAVEVGTAFKQRLAAMLTEAGAGVAAVCGCSADEGARRLMQTYALSIGLWQMLDWPPTLAAVLHRPELAVLRRDFEAELKDMLERLWA
ncbi:TetR/AcrR family transcriptional regulator [Niveibacterium umoris]|uniref:AcrR family transcriptional regulator n=1 Tax=Niveibacterium umoris TaxID=1193620 RepID=A0A840BPC1_9RHOO|nr:TetR family transcriptional regulator [Niveibacterium umoris]MBB4014484.1 AcrR family transcriptional regulator [Niveibacterium umoris]